MLKEMTTFKRVFRELILKCCSEPDEIFFKCSKAPGSRLRCLAVANKHPALAGIPSISESDRARIAEMILLIRGIKSQIFSKCIERAL